MNMKNYKQFQKKELRHFLKRKLLLLMCVLGICSMSSYAQQKITGKVVASDSAIVGATVQVKGQNIGTFTDVNGNFKLNVSTANPTLIVSFIGYASQEIQLGNRTDITIELKASEAQLDEVVVVGYSTKSKTTLTGSVSTVSGKDIAKSPSANVAASLQGRLPGLVLNQRSGEPGRENLSILIRGQGTFGDSSPLIIIDGVQRSMLERLNPEDIESISVLKDASAAIYGARAANGVILVTTKSGSKGKPSFDFSYNYALSSPTKIPDMLDAGTFAEVYNEADWYRKGRPANYTPFYPNDIIQKFRSGSDPVLYPNTNWVKEVLKPSTAQKNLNFQASGGSENVRYLFSFGSLSQEGNFRNYPAKYNQYNIRTKVDVNLTKDLTVGANINAIFNNKEYSPIATDVNFINILQANPTIVARYPNGLIGPGRLGENPLLIDQRGYDRIEDTPIYSTFTASYKFPLIEGLKFDASFNFDLNNQFEKIFTTPYYYHEYNVNTQQYDYKKGTGNSIIELNDIYRKYTTTMHNFRISYNKTFAKDHTVSLLVGSEQQKNTFKSASAYRKNFVSTAIDQINVGSNAPDDRNNSGSASANAYNNYFGRVNYDFMSKYLFEFVFRYDGSQIFPEGKRYGFFPGVSLGWRLSEEKFIKDQLPFINQLKLRASYGQLGNDRVGQYQYLQSFSFGNNYVFGTGDVPGVYANTMPNPNITWEVSKKTDVGLEANLWNRLLGIDFTLWKESRSNILAQRNLSVSNVFGFSGLPSENIGKVDNQGFELILSHSNTVGKLFYNISANTAYSRSKIIFMDEAPLAEPYQNLTGNPVGSSLYYKADGIFNTQEELDAYPHGPGAQVGDVKVLDLNNDGIIDSKDQFRFDKTAIPQYVFGLNTDFQYGNLDLNLFFQGQANAYNYDGTAAALGGTDFANATQFRAADRWSVNNPNATMPRADTWQPGATTFFLYDASFIRLKTAEIGYKLPKQLLAKTKLFKDLRVYVRGFNLLTWAKEIKWTDPEFSGNFTAYPPQRVLNFGATLKF